MYNLVSILTLKAANLGNIRSDSELLTMGLVPCLRVCSRFEEPRSTFNLALFSKSSSSKYISDMPNLYVTKLQKHHNNIFYNHIR